MPEKVDSPCEPKRFSPIASVVGLGGGGLILQPAQVDKVRLRGGALLQRNAMPPANEFLWSKPRHPYKMLPVNDELRFDVDARTSRFANREAVRIGVVWRAICVARG